MRRGLLEALGFGRRTTPPTAASRPGLSHRNHFSMGRNSPARVHRTRTNGPSSFEALTRVTTTGARTPSRFSFFSAQPAYTELNHPAGNLARLTADIIHTS